MSGEHLVCFDTDRIKEYVFATNRLREIRGASFILSRLNETDTEAAVKKVTQGYDPRYHRVFLHGGSGAVLVPSDAASNVVTEVEELYSRTTHTASITGAAVPLAPATREHGFGRRMALAALKLREAKDHKARRTVAGIEPFTRTCASCERHPAAHESALDGTLICESCHAKRKAFDDYRRHQDPNAPDDLGVLGAVSHPSGYVGFIYADGNNIGERLKELEEKGAQEYGKFAKGLNELVRESVEQALRKHERRTYEAGAVHPYESLLVGGDDLILVTASDIALNVSREIAASFRERSPEVLASAGLLQQPLTLAVAIVLAHDSFPILGFLKLATQLLRKAKQRCSEVGYTDSAVDFMVVTEAGSGDLRAARDKLTQKAFVFSNGIERVHLTQRPYTVSELDKLLACVGELKREDFPRNQLHFLYEGLFHSKAEALYRWLRARVHCSDAQETVLRRFFEAREFGDDTGDVAPWRRLDRRPNADFTTALGDLIEIYDFVPSP